MSTVQQLLTCTQAIEALAASDSPRLEAEMLLSHCLEKSKTWLYAWPEHKVDEAQQQQYFELLAARSQGQPIAYLVGCKEFWSLPLKVNQHTLIPRPETELLVEWALELAVPAQSQCVDLGTGSGAIALALASERPQWQVLGVDASEQALQVARENGRQLGFENIRFQLSNWLQSVDGVFDLIVSNPPYVEPDDPHLQQGDLRFEPQSALVAADQGLSDIKAIIATAPQQLKPGGWLLFEHGFDQGQAVANLLQEAGFSAVMTRQDLAGQDRVTGGCWHAQ